MLHPSDVHRYIRIMTTTPSRKNVLALVAAGVVALSACGDAAETGIEQLIESQGGGNVDLDVDGDGGFSIETEEGGMRIDEEGNFVITDADGSIVSGNVDAEDGSFTAESEDGSFSSNTGSDLPDEWPEAVPTPDGLSIASSTQTSDGSSTGIVLIGEADSGFLDDYAAALESAGFELESEFNADTTSQRTYTSGTWNVAVGVFADGDAVQATVTVFSEG
jgi:hypothetical protein